MLNDNERRYVYSKYTLPLESKACCSTVTKAGMLCSIGTSPHEM